MGGKERNTESNEKNNTMSVEIALEGVYPDGPEAAGKERWVGRERERHYMEQKEMGKVNQSTFML